MVVITKNNMSEIIRYHRKQSGLSQKELAELAGTGKNVVYDIEKGKITFQMDTLLKILNVLNIKLLADGPFVSDIAEVEDEMLDSGTVEEINE